MRITVVKTTNCRVLIVKSTIWGKLKFEGNLKLVNRINQEQFDDESYSILAKKRLNPGEEIIIFTNF